jgi:hypothetical protein
MLLIGDAPLSPADLHELVSGDTRLAAENAAFLSSAGGTAPVHQPSLCLLQGAHVSTPPGWRGGALLRRRQIDTRVPRYAGEQATLRCPPQGLLVGSQDATTCLIAVLACPATRIVWAAHIDEPPGDGDVASLIAALQQMGERPQLCLAGAYCDAKAAGPSECVVDVRQAVVTQRCVATRVCAGRRHTRAVMLHAGLAASFLQLLHSLDATIVLQLCCVARANTTPAGAPCSRELLLDTATWTPHAWLCADRGPEVARRFAARHCRRDLRCTLAPVWDGSQQQLVLPPFDPCCVDSWEVMALEQMLGWPDARLLQVMSTSPEHEPAWFAQGG